MKYFLFILTLCATAVAQNNSGVLVIDTLRPVSTLDTWPIAIANEVKGGPFTASDVAGLSNLPVARLTVGSLGYAESTGLYYRLSSISPVTWTNVDASNFINTPGASVSYPIALTNGGTGATNQTAALVNLGFSANLANLWAATNAEAARIAIGAGTVSGGGTNVVDLASDNATGILPVLKGGTGANSSNAARANLGFSTNLNTLWTATNASNARSEVGLGATWLTNTNVTNFRTNIGLGATWLTNTNVTNFRTAIGLGWPALRNTNESTTLLGITTNGEVLPSDIWLTFNNSLVNFRGHVWGYSFVVESPTYYYTNSAVLNQFALFLNYETNSATYGSEGITFNNESQRATTRTNIGLGWSALTNSDATNFRTAIGLGTNDQPVFNGATITGDLLAGGVEVAGGLNSITVASDGLEFTGISAATTRTNLGLGWSALTNTSSAGFQKAVFGTNVEVNNSSGLVALSLSEGQTKLLGAISFPYVGGQTQASASRANLGFSTNINALWTATNAEAARIAIGAATGGGTGSVDLSTTNATGVLPISKGGTGATSPIAIRQAIGLQTYTNTLTNSVNNVEIGSTVTNVTIGWDISPTNASYAVRSLVGLNQTNTIGMNQSTLSRTGLIITTDTTWTLTVGDGFGVTNTATTSVNFWNYLIVGRSGSTNLSNAQLRDLHNSGGGAFRVFAGSRNYSFTMDGGGQYIYIAYPASFEPARVGSVTNAMIVAGGIFNKFIVTTNTFVNSQNYTNTYLIYRTEDVVNGTGVSFTIQ